MNKRIQKRPTALGRLTTIVVSFGLFLVTVGFAWAFRSAGGASSAGPDSTDLARISCTAEGAEVLTPVVNVQSDGVHMLIDGVGEVSGITVSSDHGSIGTGFPPGETYPVATVLVVQPGKAQIACVLTDEPANESQGAQIEFTAPAGYWHDEQLACIDTGASWNERPVSWFYTDPNILQQALPRVVPGILATDQVSYGNYPNGEYGPNRYRITRDGQVEAWFQLFVYDQRSFITSMTSCDDSGIGVPGQPKLGTAATPFELPEFDRCDPYEATCSSVYVTAAEYSATRGEDASKYALPERPWDACLKDQPNGCPPDPDKLVLEILLAPPDAEAFVAGHGCGELDSPCTK